MGVRCKREHLYAKYFNMVNKLLGDRKKRKKEKKKSLAGSIFRLGSAFMSPTVFCKRVNPEVLSTLILGTSALS